MIIVQQISVLNDPKRVFSLLCDLLYYVMLIRERNYQAFGEGKSGKSVRLAVYVPDLLAYIYIYIYFIYIYI